MNDHPPTPHLDPAQPAHVVSERSLPWTLIRHAWVLARARRSIQSDPASLDASSATVEHERRAA